MSPYDSTWLTVVWRRRWVKWEEIKLTRDKSSQGEGKIINFVNETQTKSREKQNHAKTFPVSCLISCLDIKESFPRHGMGDAENNIFREVYDYCRQNKVVTRCVHKVFQPNGFTIKSQTESETFDRNKIMLGTFTISLGENQLRLTAFFSCQQSARDGRMKCLPKRKRKARNDSIHLDG